MTAGNYFLGPCDQKGSYKHVSDFGELRSYYYLKLKSLRIIKNKWNKIINQHNTFKAKI
jgi:hypothetical protein